MIGPWYDTHMNKRNQNGSVYVGIISVVALIVIGTVGYLFWSNFIANHTDNKTVKIENNTKVSNPPSPSPNNESDPSTIVLSNWKVSFMIPGFLKDTSVIYKESKSNDNPPTYSYIFTTKRIQGLGGKCATEPFGNTLSLTRFSEDEPAYPDSYWVSPEKIDGFRYVLSGPIASCSGQVVNSGSAQTSQIEIDDKASLIEMVKSIKSVK